MFLSNLHQLFEKQNFDFNKVALEVYNYQYINNALYGSFSRSVGRTPQTVKTLADIPFLPISFFKTNAVQSGNYTANIVFSSSGTTGMQQSKHFVKEVHLYEQSFITGFEQFYGSINNWCVLGLLPSYLEREGSSLVYMVDKLINMSQHPQSGFYLNDFNVLAETLQMLEANSTPTLLIGVTFALLDFAAEYPMQLNNTVIMETGGMKGRKKELTRNEVHSELKNAFGVQCIHAEYGMTEMLSQAYSNCNGIFKTPHWLKVVLRAEDDPLHIINNPGKKTTGAINIIDLANIHSCSFVATDDLGVLYADGSFEVLGRLDNSDIRGCSLLTI